MVTTWPGVKPHIYDALVRRSTSKPPSHPNYDVLKTLYDTIAIYYYSAQRLILILPSYGRWKAEST